MMFNQWDHATDAELCIELQVEENLQSRLMELLVNCHELNIGDKELFTMMIHELGHWLHDATGASIRIIKRGNEV